MTASDPVFGNSILSYAAGALMRLPQVRSRALVAPVTRTLGTIDRPASPTRAYRITLLVSTEHHRWGPRQRFLAIGAGTPETPTGPADADLVVGEWHGEDTSRETVEAMVGGQLRNTPFIPRFRVAADRCGRLRAYAIVDGALFDGCPVTTAARAVISAAECRAPDDWNDQARFVYSTEVGGALAALLFAQMTDPHPL